VTGAEQVRRMSRPTVPWWRVAVKAHRCDRFDIPALEVRVPAVSCDHARRLGVAEAHRRHDPPLPPWKPLLRLSWPYSTASEVVV
jgi:hypothetical protein